MSGGSPLLREGSVGVSGAGAEIAAVGAKVAATAAAPRGDGRYAAGVAVSAGRAWRQRVAP
ncbi:hypothetical protein [Kribbella lupini]|uniref:Uncharacterized protein n=1 Tax=Kribbella lupini TaxID=291602 RepID=A0ABP4MXX4_9ACTN